MNTEVIATGEHGGYRDRHYLLALVFAAILLPFGIISDNAFAVGQPLGECSNGCNDAIAIWKAWHLAEGQVLTVNIIDANTVSQDKLDSIKGAILDEQTVQIDNSLLGKGPAGTTSTYYLGWQGALEHVSQTDTQFRIPVKFNVIESPNGQGNITVNLSSLEDSDGYSGCTKSDANGSQILRSTITIYGVNDPSPQQLDAITRHEFGHALGLGHSTDPEDLMHATIESEYPFISECDIDAIKKLYNGTESSSIFCAK